MPGSEPTLSVVITVARGARGLDTCLRSLERERDDVLEVIVASAGPVTMNGLPDVRVAFVEGPSRALVPELWALGIERARGEAVAITISELAPKPGWARAARAALASSCAAGGPILPPSAEAGAGWAVWFLRYAVSLRGEEQKNVDDLAGDDAAYRRDALDRHRALWKRGFWEPEIHRALLAEGGTLRYEPAMAVEQAAPFGFTLFCVQRLRHGRRFGSDRARAWGLPRRLLMAAAFPLIPAVFFAKLAARAWRLGRVERLVASLPALACFLLAWSLGEASGYLAPVADARDAT